MHFTIEIKGPIVIRLAGPEDVAEIKGRLTDIEHGQAHAHALLHEILRKLVTDPAELTQIIDKAHADTEKLKASAAALRAATAAATQPATPT